MLQPFPWGKVKWHHHLVITIGQLARYVGVSTKTIRVYHAKGLLPEPDRDASGYRRYDASHAIELIKIRTLAEAGVPLARIRDLPSATEDGYQRALRDVDADLGARIRALKDTRQRLRQLADGHVQALPVEVGSHLDELARFGFTQRWVTLQRNLWILVFATHPDSAIVVFRDQAQILADPALRQLFLDYDQAYELDPLDPPGQQNARSDPAAIRCRCAARLRRRLRDPRADPGSRQFLLAGLAAARHHPPRPARRMKPVPAPAPGCRSGMPRPFRR